MSKIAIIGGGAAGLMAAIRIVELNRGNEVFLIERNDILGKKVIISGGGRCNLTTGFPDLKQILSKYPRGGRFLRHAMYSFTPSSMMEWMEDHGVPLKIEEDMRVFPKSDDGKSVVAAFEKLLSDGGVNVLLRTALKSVTKQGDGFVLSFDGRSDIAPDKVILCTGGQAYQHTGSKGDGYSFVEALGHHVTALAPSLSAFLLKEEWVKALSGISFKEVGLIFRGKDKFHVAGPMMFTHKGITGPGIFALSAYAAYEVFDGSATAHLFVDFFPDQNHEKLSESIRQEMSANPKKVFQNILGHFVPRSFAIALCDNLKASGGKKSSEFSNKDLYKVVDALKNMSLTIIGRSPGDEFVTAGGVDLGEVNPKTMESKLCPGLYLAGEILDYDGFTGGYNLQGAWATGRLAGESAGI